MLTAAWDNRFHARRALVVVAIVAAAWEYGSAGYGYPPAVIYIISCHHLLYAVVTGVDQAVIVGPHAITVAVDIPIVVMIAAVVLPADALGHKAPHAMLAAVVVVVVVVVVVGHARLPALLERARVVNFPPLSAVALADARMPVEAVRKRVGRQPLRWAVLPELVAAVAHVVVGAERQITVYRYRVAVFAVGVDFVVSIFVAKPERAHLTVSVISAPEAFALAPPHPPPALPRLPVSVNAARTLSQLSAGATVGASVTLGADVVGIGDGCKVTVGEGVPIDV